MAAKTGFSSPHSRMEDLAYKVCVKELRKNNLKANLNKIYPVW